VIPQCLSICPSVTFTSLLGAVITLVGSNTSNISLLPNSDKIVIWRFLCSRRLILCLHTIFRALIYWAHRAVIFAIAWFSSSFCHFFFHFFKRISPNNNNQHDQTKFLYSAKKFCKFKNKVTICSYSSFAKSVTVTVTFVVLMDHLVNMSEGCHSLRNN